MTPSGPSRRTSDRGDDAEGEFRFALGAYGCAGVIGSAHLVETPDDAAREIGRAEGLREITIAAVVDNVERPAAGKGDDRSAAGHRLNDGLAEGFLKRRQHRKSTRLNSSH